MKFKNSLLILLLYACCDVFAQSNFREEWRITDPSYQLEKFSMKNILKSHDSFLNKSIEENNIRHQLYANLYFANDYMRTAEFSTAMEYYLKALEIGKNSKKNGWEGWTQMRMSGVYMELTEWEKGIKYAHLGLNNCANAKDSLCMGESYEKLSVFYGKVDSLKKAQECYDKASVLLKAHGDELRLAQLHANYGLILSKQKKYFDAIKSHQLAIEIFEKSKLTIYVNIAKHNIAVCLTGLKHYDSSESLIKQSIKSNVENEFDDNLITNYQALYELYELTSKPDSANKYIKLFYNQKDSLIGEETKAKIAKLLVDNKLKETELNTEKAERKTLTMKVWIGIVLWVFFLVVILWRLQIKSFKKEQLNKENNLTQLTKLLNRKNSQLIEFEAIIENLKSEVVDISKLEEIIPTPVNKILTSDDWQQYKNVFENSFPGFIQKLRIKHTDISESEERLVVLIKCKLNSKEIANVLGINPESVKKSRQRLRKRLAIEREQSLEAFIEKGF